MVALLVLSLVPAAPAAEPEPVVLGAVISLSGPDATRGTGLLAAYAATIAWINGQGGVLVAGTRHPLALALLDDQGSPRRAAALASVLVGRRGATVLLGATRRDLSLAIARAVADVPVVGFDGLAGEGVPGNLYSVAPSLDSALAQALSGAALAWRMAGSGPDRVGAVVLTDDEAGRALAEQALERAAFPLVAGERAGLAIALAPASGWPDRGVVVTEGCGGTPSSPATLVLCLEPWVGRVDAPLPPWLAHVPAPRDIVVSASVAVLVAAAAIETARSPIGVIVADVLEVTTFETWAGRVRLAGGVNAAAAAGVFQVGAGGLRPFDGAEPFDLSLP